MATEPSAKARERASGWFSPPRESAQHKALARDFAAFAAEAVEAKWGERDDEQREEFQHFQDQVIVALGSFGILRSEIIPEIGRLRRAAIGSALATKGKSDGSKPNNERKNPMKEERRRLNRMHWLKQIFPRTLYSLYRTEDGTREFAIWRQWLGRAYDYRRFPVSERVN